jgi:hypothetical protein
VDADHGSWAAHQTPQGRLDESAATDHDSMSSDKTNEVAAVAGASGDETLASDLDEREGSDDERSVADLGS